MAQVHDISLHLQPVQDIQIESRLTRTQYQYVLQHLDEKELRQWADKFLRELQKQPELADVTTDQQDLGQQMMIDVNRDAAARFGLDVSTIVQDLYDAFGQRQIATIYGPVYQYKVILEVAPEYRNTADALDERLFQESDQPAGGDRFPNPAVVKHRANSRLRCRYRFCQTG